MNYSKVPEDTATLELLESVPEPTDADKASLGSLIMRYAGLSDLENRAVDVAMAWGYSPEQLMVECREIWLNGFYPNFDSTKEEHYQ